MNYFRRIAAWWRGEAAAGRSLGLRSAIIVPSDAEELADVSFYQEGMDWSKYPHRAVILRVGQNVWKDTSFELFYEQARARGIAIGGYFFFDGRASPAQQANVIVSAMQGKRFDLELYIDWEKNYGGQYEGLPRVVELMQRVEAAGVACKAVGMYTGYYWFTGNSNAVTHAEQYKYLQSRPLWLAWYASSSVVKIPPPWTDYTLWQWGTPAISWGQPTAEIDANKSRYNRVEFADRYLSGGNNMTETHEGLVKTDLNVRAGPGVSYAQKLPPGGYLRVGDRVYGVLDAATKWFHFFRIVRTGGVVEVWDAWASAVDERYMIVSPLASLPEIEIVYDPSAVKVTLRPQ